MTKATNTADDGRAAALLASYERAGYGRVCPRILQPAEPFLALSGEDIRRRMYLLNDAAGREFCLRPDLTIPVALDYLASDAAGRPASFCYLGPVFRQRGDAAGEFLQAGIESFGRDDKAAADAETLALGLEATAHYGLAGPEIRMGDVGLFAALIEALGLPPVWKRRLVKDFNRKALLAEDLDRLALSAASERSEYQGVLAALANSDPKGARALVADLLSIAGISTVGGRSVGEIADRFLEQAELGASAALPRETRALIERFFADRRRAGRRGGRAVEACGGGRHRPCAGARPVREPHRPPGRARHRYAPDQVRDRLRPRPRLLHGLRVRVARSAEPRRRSARRRRAL